MQNSMKKRAPSTQVAEEFLRGVEQLDERVWLVLVALHGRVEQLEALVPAGVLLGGRRGLLPCPRA
jgi:hypothetical protein